MADEKKVTKDDVKKLFIQVDSLNEKLTKATKVVTDLEDQKSALVKTIAEVAGKGPFLRGGKTLKIVKRERKDEDENVIGETWFFRGESEKEVQSMD